MINKLTLFLSRTSTAKRIKNVILRHWRLLQEHNIFREAFRKQWLNILSLMKRFFSCAIAAHNHGKWSHSNQRQRRHHPEPLSTCESDLESIVALQCPSGLSSTSVSLRTHYMQALDNTWVPCNVQIVNFHLSRQFCHSHLKFRSGLLSNWKPTKEVGTELIFILKCTAPITSKLPHKRWNYNFKSSQINKVSVIRAVS